MHEADVHRNKFKQSELNRSCTGILFPADRIAALREGLSERHCRSDGTGGNAPHVVKQPVGSITGTLCVHIYICMYTYIYIYVYTRYCKRSLQDNGDYVLC